MSEYRKLEDVLHILDNVMFDEGIKHKGKAIRKRLKELPAEDVKKVVRCKECQLRANKKCPRVYLHTTGWLDPTKDEDFCSVGVKKEGVEK